MLRTVVTSLESVSPYSQSQKIRSPKEPRETSADHEKRCWKERCHVNDKGNVFIPPMAFKNCLAEAAKYLGMQIPGKGKATYTKHVEAGVLVLEGLTLPQKIDDVEGEWLFLPADGKRGSGKRVDKCYPLFREWKGDLLWHILDDAITPDVFETHIREAGNFIGIGRFRPRNNGYYGRFKVTDIEWQ